MVAREFVAFEQVINEEKALLGGLRTWTGGQSKSFALEPPGHFPLHSKNRSVKNEVAVPVIVLELSQLIVLVPTTVVCVASL